MSNAVDNEEVVLEVDMYLCFIVKAIHQAVEGLECVPIGGLSSIAANLWWWGVLVRANYTD